VKLSDVVSNAGLAIYAEVALLIFFAIFVVIVVRTMLRRDGDEAARLPLDDGARRDEGGLS
jgi:cbb3-type cytochrome oxidase subunit 3